MPPLAFIEDPTPLPSAGEAAFQFAVLMGLVLANGFFVAAEFAMVKVRSARIESLAREGGLRARSAAHVLAHVDAYLSACQLGITLASLGLGWFGEPYLSRWILPVLRAAGATGEASSHMIAGGIAFFVITFLHIVAGEMAPKSLAIRKAEPTALWAAIPLRVFNAVFYPFIWMLNSSANLLLRAAGIKPADEDEAEAGADELRMIVARSHLSRRARVFMENILDFPSKVARQIMQPRTAMVMLRAEASVEHNLRVAEDNGHSRYPVCTGRNEDVVGLVLIKDLHQAKAKGEADMRKVMRRPLYLPETCPVDRLLLEFQRRRQHMAILLDEYGATVGLATLEDVLEEIVGEIQDELDAEQPQVRSVGPGEFLVEGLCPLPDFAEAAGVNMDEFTESADTVAGAVLSLIGTEPRVGQTAEWNGWEFRVEAVAGRRIAQVKVRRTSGEAVKGQSPAS